MVINQQGEDPIGLIDMDGTIADLDKRKREEMAKLRSPGENADDEDRDYDAIPHLKARWDLIKRRPGFWRELPRLEFGFDVPWEMQQLGFDCSILTKGPSSASAAWSEKFEWCRLHVPDLSVHVGEEKGLVYGKVLVDDWPPYIENWRRHRPRGYVVSIAQPWNVTVEKQFNNCVRYDGSNLYLVRELLEAAKASLIK